MKLFVALLLLVSHAIGASAKWNKHYALVNKDIQSIERLPNKDLELKIRLFELYGEKLSLLLEVENDLRMAYLDDSRVKPKLDSSLALQQQVLRKIKSVSDSILGSTRDKAIIGKIHYYKALSYLFVKDYKSYEYSLLKAEKYATDPKVLHAIRVKLADHYYNEKRFRQAVQRYRIAAKDKKDRWRAKIIYNLAWCEFKLGMEKTALARIKFAYRLSESKYYHRIGDQLTDSIMLFYANAKRTDEGLQFLRQTKQNTPDQLLRYAHHVYELGRKPDVIKVFQEMDQISSSIEDKTKMLTKKVEIYRNLKQFARIQNNLASYKKELAKSKERPTKLSKEALVTAVLGYNGYLQEIIKAKNLGDAKAKKRYAAYIYNNLETLKEVDPQNSPQYAYFQGETYMELGRYKTATIIYTNAIKSANAQKSPDKEVLKKVFDSVFKSMEKSPTRPSRLVYVFESYLRHFPKSPTADSIHQRLIGLSMKEKDKRPVLARIARYNQAYPGRINVQRDYYKQLLNFYIDQKNTKALESLKSALAKGFLKFDQKEINLVAGSIESLRFEKYENLAKAGKKEEALAGFLAIYKDPKNGRDLRVAALRKSQYLQNDLKKYDDLTSSVGSALKVYSPNEKRRHEKELKYYLTNICMSSFSSLARPDQNCLHLKSAWTKASLPFPNELVELYFRKTVSLNRYEKALDLAGKDPTRLDYLFQTLTLGSPNFDHQIYGELYKSPRFKNQIDNLIKLRFWRNWYKGLSLDAQDEFAGSLSISELKSSYLDKTKKMREALGAQIFKLPGTPAGEKEVTFEDFSKYLEALTMATGEGFQKIDATFSSVDPNYLPYLVQEQAKKVLAPIDGIENYSPNTKDENLASAIKKEMQSIASIYKQKHKQYTDFYPLALEGVIKGVGAHYYKEGMRAPAFSPFIKGAIWEGYL